MRSKRVWPRISNTIDTVRNQGRRKKHDQTKLRRQPCDRGEARPARAASQVKRREVWSEIIMLPIPMDANLHSDHVFDRLFFSLQLSLPPFVDGAS